MKYEVPFRIIVIHAPAGVSMKVQRGKFELLEPDVEGDTKTFEFGITVELTGDVPNFLGPFAQGPKNARFVYVNSGTYAGEAGTPWSRRAKLSLMSITKAEVEH